MISEILDRTDASHESPGGLATEDLDVTFEQLVGNERSLKSINSHMPDLPHLCKLMAERWRQRRAV